MKLKSTNQPVILTGHVHEHDERTYLECLVPTPRKDLTRPQNHLQWVRHDRLVKPKKGAAYAD